MKKTGADKARPMGSARTNKKKDGGAKWRGMTNLRTSENLDHYVENPGENVIESFEHR